MKTIKIMVMVLSLSVMYQFAAAQGCSGNRVLMSIGFRGCGCNNCTKQCVAPADTAAYAANGWRYGGGCSRFCCFTDGFRSGDEMNFTLETALTEIYPNPVFGSLNIAFTLSEPGEVTLEVFDVTGRF